MKEIGPIIGKIMAAKGITLVQAAKWLEVSHSAIQKFTQGQASLGSEKQLFLAKRVGLEPGFVTAGTYPFGKNRFWKLWFSRQRYSDMEPLHTVIRASGNASIVILCPTITGKPKPGDDHRFYKNPPYAIAMKDHADNIFLFRRMDEAEFLVWEWHTGKNPFSQMMDWAEAEDRHIKLKYGTLAINDELYMKIKTRWDEIARDEIEGLFMEALPIMQPARTNKEETLSVGERHMIEVIRDSGLSPYDVLKATSSSNLAP